MADCECMEGCPFLLGIMDTSGYDLDYYMENLCGGDNSKCARFMVYRKLGRENVPPDLYPDQVERAREYLVQHAG